MRLTIKKGERYLVNEIAGFEEDCIPNAIQKLCVLEDLEEAGRLVKLPCKVGDTVYKCNADHYTEYRVHHFTIVDKGVYAYLELTYDKKSIVDIKEFGKTVFCTPEEADAALKGA